jgi:catechol 2,3-dioxygenase-like lactoylglutathione lyase family enzyme
MERTTPFAILGLDRIRVAAADFAAAAASLQKLLGHAAEVGEEDATVRLSNMSLEIVPSDQGTEGLCGLAFTIDNAQAMHRTCERRALHPSAPVAFAESDTQGGLFEGRHFALSVEATHGVPISLVEHTAKPAHTRQSAAQGAITGLDHIVVRTTHPNRAAALYGARLGLDMRLDRAEPKWGARLMFFRCGDLVVEVVHNLNEPASDMPDKLWGLSWRTPNIEAAHARLVSSGFSVSEIRTGRKPGTRVFTVKDGTLGVPTLVLQPPAREDN